MIYLDGRVFVTAAEAHEHLGDDITPAMVRDWRRRRLVTGYRLGRSTYYELDSLIDVEYLLRSGGRGRPRRAA